MDINNAPDYKAYGIDECQARNILSMTPQELEYAYRIRQLQYRLIDAENAVNDELENCRLCNNADDNIILSCVSEEDFMQIVSFFEKNQDSNRDENSQWESAVRDYINKMKSSQ